jgi:hypothetical protein
MSFTVYHRVPKNLTGDVLYPLNVLKHTHPGIYADQAAKYSGREELMQTAIPGLNCLWNDVLHFSLVHPKLIFDALRTIGYGYRPHRIFEIGSSLLDPGNCLLLVHSVDGSTKEFLQCAPENFSPAGTLSGETVAYFTQCFNEGIHPLLFAGVPHLLYRGSVDISGCPVVEV